MKLIKNIPFLLLLLLAGCAYYNTFFNAEDNYRQGIEKIESSTDKNITPAIRSNFDAAISKSWRVISVYGDSNSWSDDALFLIGKSHYHLEEYLKAKEVLESFLQKYLKSSLIPEVELWLARTFLKLENTEQAIKKLNDIISKSSTEEIIATAYYFLGDIYFEEMDFESAITYYLRCLEYSSSEDIAGNSQYKLADAFFNLKQYQQASDEYKKVLYYEINTLKQFDAIIQMANALVQIENFEEAEEALNNLLRDQRFQKQYSLIAAKLANIVEFKGDKEYAIEKYYEVIDKYPKTEGSALSSFYLAQLYEFEYGMLDSAKVKYDNVPKQFNKSEAAPESKKRSGILESYQKIRNALRNDKQAIYKLLHGDSTIIDSLVTGQDTILYSGISDSTTYDNVVPNIFFNENMTVDSLSVNTFNEQFPTNNENQVSQNQQSTKIKQQKVAILRTPEEIESSLLKNSFSLAEFFLLNYEHYDSAKFAYTYFIENFSDSLLSPKAYYSLHYIYDQKSTDSLKADSIKSIILTRYPNSIYSKKLLGKLVSADAIIDYSKTRFLQAEELIEANQYNEAITTFYAIANADTSSIWAIKSLYAAGFIYENYIHDDSSAVKSYSILAERYPESEQGKIAANKIKKPPIEKKAAAVIDSVKKDEVPKNVNEQPSVTDSVETVLEPGSKDKEIEKPEF